MPIFKRPSVYKKSLPWAASESQVPPKPSFGILESLGIRKKREQQKPANVRPQSQGFLGSDGFVKEWQLREFAKKKAPYEYFPGTTQWMGRGKREELMKELIDRVKAEAKKQGRQTYGISSEMFKRVIKKIEDPSAPGGSELYHLHRAGQYNKEKELRRKAQVWKEWAKGKG